MGISFDILFIIMLDEMSDYSQSRPKTPPIESRSRLIRLLETFRGVIQGFYTITRVLLNINTRRTTEQLHSDKKQNK